MTMRLLMTAVVLLLAGCEIPGMGPDPKLVERDADAKAIGSACRHGLRNIEDCYTLNEKAPKAAVFIGWKEMDEYMRENKIEGILSTVVKPPPPAPPVEEILETTKPEGEEPKPTSSGRASAK